MIAAIGQYAHQQGIFFIGFDVLEDQDGQLLIDNFRSMARLRHTLRRWEKRWLNIPATTEWMVDSILTT